MDQTDPPKSERIFSTGNFSLDLAIGLVDTDGSKGIPEHSVIELASKPETAEEKIARDVARRLRGLPVPNHAMQFSQSLQDLMETLPHKERMKLMQQIQEWTKHYT
jgi:hypothetical protein